MHICVKCFDLHTVYGRLALLANIWLTFEVACSQMKILLIVFYPLVLNIEVGKR